MVQNDRLFSTNRKKRKLKDKKINIYEEQVKRDKFGTPIGIELVEVYTHLWAYARQSSANEYWQNQFYSSQTYTVDMIFSINYTEGINNKMVIEYNGNKYAIERLDYFEGYKEDILISARLLGKFNEGK